MRKVFQNFLVILCIVTAFATCDKDDDDNKDA